MTMAELDVLTQQAIGEARKARAEWRTSMGMNGGGAHGPQGAADSTSAAGLFDLAAMARQGAGRRRAEDA